MSLSLSLQSQKYSRVLGDEGSVHVNVKDNYSGLLVREGDRNTLAEPFPVKALVGECASVPGSVCSTIVPVSLNTSLEEWEERGSSVITECNSLFRWFGVSRSDALFQRNLFALLSCKKLSYLLCF